MKILVISNSLLVESQGSGYVIVNTAKALETLGYEVDMIPPASFDFLAFLKSKATNYRRAIGMGKWILTNSKKIDAYDLLIFYGAEASLALFLLKNLVRKKIKTILHSNGLELHVEYRTRYFKDYWPNHKRWYHFDEKLLFKYCYYHVDAIITVSEYDKNFAVSQLKISPAKVYVNEPFLPDIYFTELSEATLLKKPVITFCGSWIARKGVNLIKAAMPDILRKYTHYKFRLIGVGANFKKEDHFPEDVLASIELYPLVVNKKELIELYKDTDIFLFPSFCESFGLVVAEAMLYSCAVVCGPTGIAATLVNKTDAIVLEFPSKDSITEALTELITDSALKKKIQSNAMAKVKELNRNTYTVKMKKIMEQIENL